jgi:hypothetical protein
MFTARLKDALADNWRRKARPSQLPPPGDWAGWLVLSGRGWGKSWGAGLAVTVQTNRPSAAPLIALHWLLPLLRIVATSWSRANLAYSPQLATGFDPNMSPPSAS